MRFVFEDYVLDPDRRELTRGSEAISIGPQVFDLLVYLVENRERVVSKDSLLDVVWGVVEARACLLVTNRTGFCFCLRHDALMLCVIETCQS